jgi:thiamine biosynthesis protein ThiI
MIKISCDLAKRMNAVVLITGDSVGQVASQTLSNIRAISEVSNIPIIRPLSGYNKEDIVNKAKDIGTYEISIEPYEDCCSFFVPPHPETKAKMDKVMLIQNSLGLDEIYIKTISEIEELKIEYLGD